MNEIEYGNIMRKVASLWQHSPLPGDTLEFGEALLLPLPAEFVSAAVDSLAVEDRPHAPTIGQIYQRSIALAQPDVPDADQAWGEVKRWINRVGLTRGIRGATEIEWSHPIVQRVADSMGWQTLCESENEVADRAHFLQLYRTSLERLVREQNMPESVRRVRAKVNAHEIGGPQPIANILEAWKPE